MTTRTPTWINDRQHDRDLAKFVLEGAEFVQHIVSRAADELYRTSGHQHLTFASATDAGTPETFRAIVEAIYLHLKHDQRLRYEYEGAFDDVTYEQQVRLPGVLRQQNRDTCLDLALFFASCLANAKLWPIVVVVHGHALTACWVTTPDSLREPLLSLNELGQHLDSGKIVAVECTGFAEGFPKRQHKLGYEEACREAQELLQALPTHDFSCALDIRRAWETGVRPCQAPPTRRPGVPFQSPPLPPYFVPRPDDLDRVRQALLSTSNGPGLVISAVYGMGGIGKTTPAAALVRQADVRDWRPGRPSEQRNGRAP
jgi:hypothetical protein